jgi:hypothetical protein
MTNTTIAQRRRGSLTLLTAIAFASAISYGSSDAATINACVGPNGGLRVVDATKGEGCRPPEKPLSWSTTGEQGPQGTPGTNGTNGTNGVSGYEIVEKLFNESSGFGNTLGFLISIECPAGKKMLSAGGDASWFVGNTIISFAILSNTFLFTSNGIAAANVTITKPGGGFFSANEGVSGRVQAVCAIAL